MKFSIIAAVDRNNGLGCATFTPDGLYQSGTIPWSNKEDLLFFRQTTLNSTIIMGRHTWESLPRKLDHRTHIVVTSKDIPDIETSTSLYGALQLAGTLNQPIFVIGGAQLFLEALTIYWHMIDTIYLSRIPGDYNCNVFFPIRALGPLENTSIIEGTTLLVNKLIPTRNHGEYQYLNLLQHIMDVGDVRMDRTQTGTKSVFGEKMEFDLRDGFPLLTTKRTWFTGIKKELLFFISGKTDTKILEVQGVNIWKGNTSKAFLEKSKLPWREGDMGPGYSHQWRHAGALYHGCDADYQGQGVDQLAELIHGIKNDPYGRRHIIDSWSVPDIKDMALPPCHCFVQFYVSNNELGQPTFLDCLLHQRSADMFLGVPFNIASYSMLLLIVAYITGLTARKFIHSLGDAHIYSTHYEAVTEQLKRRPFSFPTVTINPEVTDIDSLQESDITLSNYKCWDKITAVMAV